MPKTPKSVQSESVIPHNVEAERALLGSILLDNSALNLALETVTKDDFFSEAHRITFEQMLLITEKNRSVDFVTLCEELSKQGQTEKAGGAAYLAALTDGVPIGTSVAVSEYSRIVKEKSLLRQLISGSNNLITRSVDGVDDPATIIDLGIEQLYGLLGAQRGKGFEHVGRIIKDEFVTLQNIFEGKRVRGVPTGLTDLDALIGGLQEQELSIIAARPSLGKTALALTIALEAARNGTKVGFFSLEMGKVSLVTRAIAMQAKVNLYKLCSGFASREELGKLTYAAREISNLPLWIDDTASLSVTEFRSRARRLMLEQQAKLFMVDYLQLLTTPEKRWDSRNAEVTWISGQLKGFTKQEKVHVSVMSQLSRESERGRRRKPRLSDLRDSGSLEQDADLVIFIWRKAVEAAETTDGETTLIVAKQRNGLTGEVPVTFLRPYTLFVNATRAGERPEEPDKWYDK